MSTEPHRDQGLRSRAGAAVKQIVRGFQVTNHEDSRHNRHYTLAYVTVTPVTRETEPINYNSLPRENSWQI